MSQTTIKREVNHGPSAKRSTWPRAHNHGKHSELQGFPNTRGLNSSAGGKKKK